jgi:mono/diheme cytochrome c family protein
MPDERVSTACLARFRWQPFAVALVLLSPGIPASAQDGPAKSEAGIYDSAQAERGKLVFQSTCTTCHNYDLSGNSGRGPVLAGEAFTSNWEGESLGVLFAKLKTTMPRNNPASLTDDVYLELMAYILQANAFRAGPRPLTVEALNSATVPGKAGTATIPNFAMVEIVGCLAQSNDAWTLTMATAPLATKDQPASPDELRSSAVRPRTLENFRLMSVNGFEPESHKGHTVQAKGLLYRAPNDNRLNVTALATIDPTCSR